MRSKQGNIVDKKTSQWLQVPSKPADAEKHRHLRFGNSKLVFEQITYW